MLKDIFGRKYKYLFEVGDKGIIVYKRFGIFGRYKFVELTKKQYLQLLKYKIVLPAIGDKIFF